MISFLKPTPEKAGESDVFSLPDFAFYNLRTFANPLRHVLTLSPHPHFQQLLPACYLQWVNYASI